ncbi:MAG: TetR family transcriptional regulator [Thermoleophilaceae bacterium]
MRALESNEIRQDLRGRHGLSPEEVAVIQRQRLLRAIVACAAVKGVQRTTIADIVQAASTSRSAFYEHFESKEECFVEAYDQITAEFIAAAIEASRDAQTWGAALDAGIAAFFRWGAEKPDQAIPTMVEIHAVGPAGLAARWRAIEQWTRLNRAVSARARREEPTLPIVDDFACSSIVIVAEAHAHDYARRGIAHRLDELIEPMQRFAKAIIRGLPADGPQT